PCDDLHIGVCIQISLKKEELRACARPARDAWQRVRDSRNERIGAIRHYVERRLKSAVKSPRGIGPPPEETVAPEGHQRGGRLECGHRIAADDEIVNRLGNVARESTHLKIQSTDVDAKGQGTLENTPRASIGVVDATRPVGLALIRAVSLPWIEPAEATETGDGDGGVVQCAELNGCISPQEASIRPNGKPTQWMEPAAERSHAGLRDRTPHTCRNGVAQGGRRMPPRKRRLMEA